MRYPVRHVDGTVVREGGCTGENLVAKVWVGPLQEVGGTEQEFDSAPQDSVAMVAAACHAHHPKIRHPWNS